MMHRGHLLGTALLTVLASIGMLSFDARSSRAQAQAPETAVRLSVVGTVAPNTRTAEVEVTVTAARAVSGEIVVRSRRFDSAQVAFRVPVEIAADATITFPLAIPVQWGELDVAAELIADGQVLADDQLRRFADGQGGRAVVGLLGVTSNQDRVPLGVGAGSADLVELSNDRMLASGLSAYTAVVAAPTAVRELNEGALAILIGFVSGGGDLLVAGPEGSLDAVVEPANPPFLGLGRVLHVGDEWQAALEPSGVYRVSSFDGGSGVVGGDGQIDPTADLARDAGVQLPGVSRMGWLLLAYVIVAGPVVYLVLRWRNRSPLAWVVLPAVALVFTVGALIAGSELRGDRGNSHVTIVEVWPSGSSASTSALFTASNGADRNVQLPAGWQYLGGASVFQQSSAPVEITPGRSGSDVTLDMAVGGIATAAFAGPAAQFDDALRFESVQLAGANATGIVVNDTEAELVDVLVFWGTRVVELGDVPAGGSSEFSIEHSASVGGRLRELDRWPSSFDQFGRLGSGDSDVSSAAWSAWRSQAGWNTFSAGVIGVAGWTREFDAPVGGVAAGRTALVARMNLPPSVTVGTPLPVHVVSDPDPDPQVADGFFSVGFVSRIDVPASLTSTELTVSVERTTSTLEWWTDGQWRPVELPEGALELQPPAGSLVNGSIWVRARVPEWTWPIRPTVSASVAGGGELLELLEPGDLRSRGDGQFGGPIAGPSVLGDVLEVEVEPGNTLVVEGEIFGGEWDEWVVSLDEGDEVRLALSARHDSFLAVRNPDGVQFAENDDFPQCCDSGLTFTARATGDYVIEARALGDSGQGAYELTIDRVEP